VWQSELREQLMRDGYEVSGLGPDDMTAFMQKEVAQRARVIQMANIKTD
jgi:hypothetical protein